MDNVEKRARKILAESYRKCGERETADKVESGSDLDRFDEMVTFPSIIAALTPPEVSDTTQRLIDLLIERDRIGRTKYGTTLDRTDLTRDQWLQHMVEELLDGAGYALAAQRPEAE